jgi:hypothetical protein
MPSYANLPEQLDEEKFAKHLEGYKLQYKWFETIKIGSYSLSDKSEFSPKVVEKVLNDFELFDETTQQSYNRDHQDRRRIIRQKVDEIHLLNCVVEISPPYAAKGCGGH